jgi:hypothetical protein
MSCIFTEKISSLIDGELATSEARDVERHLMICAECQQLRADFLNLRTQISNFEPSLQPSVQNRALKKLLSTERHIPVRGLQWGFGTQAVAFATILIIGAIVGLIFYQNTKTPDPINQQVARQSPSPEPSVSPEKQKEVAAPEKDAGGKTTPKPAPATPVKRVRPREPKPGEQFASIPESPRSADAETMTAMHFEKSETLLRAFRNVRLNEPGTAAQVRSERNRAKQLVFQNMILRREADSAGDVQIASLLESLEPILLDIANLPDRPNKDSVKVIRERMERKNIVALLQVNSTALARALD